MINFFFPTCRVYSKKQTRVTVNQHIFKFGLNDIFIENKINDDNYENIQVAEYLQKIQPHLKVQVKID